MCLMKRSATVFCALLVLALLPAASLAQPAPGDDISGKDVKSFIPNIKPGLDIPYLESAISIDGELDDAGWMGAAQASNFSETYPDDQAKPPIEVKVYLTYDDANLYIAYKIFDDPSAIRANLSDRDRIWQDDYSGMLLDTNGDGQEVYFIAANPLGIQGDTRSSRGREDVTFDLVYESDGKVTEDGYQIEMAIPFRSLRFPKRDIQSWKATFWITHPRDSRNTYSWAAIDRDNPCFTCQFGSLSGMQGVKSGNNLELLPSLTGSQSGILRDFDTPAAGIDNDRVHAEPSLDVKYGITSDLTADVTLNPDFSQIEADAAQIDVNSTFALSFEERRPFFQEGSDLFRTFLETVYTRSINDPIVASKLTGRFGNTNVAYIGARDINTPLLLPFEESSSLVRGGKSISNIVRLQQNFENNSFIGALVTDRRLEAGGSGSTVGLDGAVRFLKKYTLEGQFVTSFTDEANDPGLSEVLSDDTFDGGQHTIALDGESFWGNAFYASIDRSARHWNFDVTYQQYSPTFRADNGFITQNDNRRLTLFQGYTFYPDNIGFIERINTFVEAARIWNFAGTKKDEWIAPILSVRMKRQTSVNLFYALSRELFRDIQFDGIRRFNVSVYSNFSEPVQLGFSATTGRAIARNLETPELGRNFNFSTSATLRPTQRLNLQPNFTYAALTDLDTGEAFFSGYIARMRGTYQFTRRFLLRGVVQYNDFSERLEIDPLFTYRINPFTVFHIGSTHRLDTFDNRPDDPSRFLRQTSRQFFFKFQYLVRT